ncbi:tetratricopeptide repeat protein [Candidatus Uabimicrobium sp. HlEnr_7]|uniref:protein kinase domain-containing protein n=1 Tax=Candidatus Uabimicrobium helgolandensis TaxID=3095367 RepID=UPI00355751ED
MQLLNEKYKFVKVLGQGGMGRVFLCCDINSNDFVAIKECFDQNSQKNLRRIKREYYFMKKIVHPHVVKGLEFFCIGNRSFIVMEYLQGITLNDFIKTKSQSISLDKQIEIAKQICEAVIELNKNGIIHRDLKPSNIILCGENYHPKILDLGIAKCVNKELTDLTKTGAVVGTPGYISPEQVKGKVKKNTDVFSLGIIFYQFFSWQKRSPFSTGSNVTTMDRVVHQNLPPLATTIKIKDKRSLHLSNLLENALQKSSVLRYSSVEKMLYEFKKIDQNITLIYLEKFFVFLKKYKSITLIITSILFSIILFYSFPKRLAKTEDNITILMNKIIMLSASGNYNQIIQHADKIIAQNNTFTKAYFHKGIAYAKFKKYDLAEKNFTKAIKLGSLSAMTYNNRGLTYLDRKMYNLAILDFTKAIEIKDRSYNAYYNRGQAYFRQKKYKQAEKDYNVALKISPKYADAYFAKGMLYAQQKKLHMALKNYTQTIKHNSKHGLAYEGRAIIHAQQKKYKLALEDFNRAIKYNSRSASLYTNRGFFHHSQGKFELAKIDYDKAIELNPKYAMAFYNRGYLAFKMKKFDLAISNWRKAIVLGIKTIKLRNDLEKAKKLARMPYKK